MIKQHRAGGRVQSYHVRPLRYTVSAGGSEDDRWGAHIVGLLYVAIGAVMLLRPLVQTLGRGSQLFLSIFGTPATVGPALRLDGPLMLVAAAVAAVGVGIVADRAWAYLLGMVLALVLSMPIFPIGTAVGCVLVYVLWQQMPPWSPAPAETEA